MRDLDPGRELTARSVTLPDGRALRVVEAGAGDPLVVFEAGGGACASEWIAVQRSVSEHTRTLSYDRAGYGGSDVDTRPRLVPTLTRDLTDLLDALGETRPVVLVAHSWGGPIARRFALDAPDRVAGLVFVDATVSELMTRRDARLASGMAAVQVALMRLGLPNPMTRMLAATFGPDFAPEDRAIMIRDFADKQGTITFRREVKEIAGTLPALEQWQQAGYPPVPVASVVGATPTRGQAELRAKLVEHQRDEMQRHNGTLHVVEGAGHFVPQQRPLEAARAIVELVELIRATSTWQASPDANPGGDVPGQG